MASLQGRLGKCRVPDGIKGFAEVERNDRNMFVSLEKFIDVMNDEDYGSCGGACGTKGKLVFDEVVHWWG